MNGPKPPRVPELLAPAGDEEALRAAVANGADAVYFGLDDFNARRRASNFTLARLPELIRWLHRRNVRGYVAFNTLVYPDELERAGQYILGIARAGADAVIVQDLGLMRLIRAMCPTLPIHASTQATQTHPDGIEALRSLGVSRVILARELSLPQIEALARSCRMEWEVFVHGALCISFSGQCLASEVRWSRSANRGLCAQACRLPYDLAVDDTARDAGEHRYPLSPRDLAAAPLVGRLAALGAAALKIEGRLKSAAYVASATRVYREVLDAVARGEPSRLTREQEQELTLSFSRGFSTGFLEGRRPAALVDGRFPRSRGLLMGHVHERTRRGVVVRLLEEHGSGDSPLRPGDGVVFDEGRPDGPEQGGRVYEVQRLPGRPARIEVAFGREDLDLRRVVPGSRVWKTDDPALRRRLERSARQEDAVRRSPLAVRVDAAVGQPLRLTARDAAGREVSVESTRPLEAAARHPLTLGLLREQLRRLGDTPFELDALELIGPDGATLEVPAMAPKSLLNDLRRQVVDRLLDLQERGAVHAVVEPDALGRLRAGPPQRADTPIRPEWSLLVRTGPQLEAAVSWAASAAVRPSLIYADLATADLAGALERIRAAGCAAGLATTQVMLPGEEALLQKIIDARPDVTLVRNLAAHARLRQLAPECPQVADYSLNVANEQAADVLIDAGFERITPGLDLDLGQLTALRRWAPNAVIELIIHGRVPLFHMAHCVTSAALGRGGDCGACGPASAQACAAGDVSLLDRNGESHPLLLDGARRTTAFGAQVQSALGLWPRVAQLRPDWVRVELLRESEGQTVAVLEVIAALLAERIAPPEALRRIERHYPQGVTSGTLGGAEPRPHRR